MTNPLPRYSADALAVVRGYYASLSPAERKVADYILQDPENILRMTLAEVAEQSGVSDATAVRFFRSLGYADWLNFKIALTRSIPDTTKLVLEDIQADDSPGLVARKVILGSVQALQDTLAVLDENAFCRALELLKQADRILIAGVGTSGPIAHEMYHRLFRLGLNCQVITDAYLQVMQAALLTPADLLVAISQTGDSTDPIRTAQEAQLNGCPVLAITGNRLSSLAHHADVVLVSVSHEFRGETTASRNAQYALIHALYAGLALQALPTARQNEARIWEALMRTPSFQTKK